MRVISFISFEISLPLRLVTQPFWGRKDCVTSRADPLFTSHAWRVTSQENDCVGGAGATFVIVGHRATFRLTFSYCYVTISQPIRAHVRFNWTPVLWQCSEIVLGDISCSSLLIESWMASHVWRSGECCCSASHGQERISACYCTPTKIPAGKNVFSSRWSCKCHFTDFIPESSVRSSTLLRFGSQF